MAVRRQLDKDPQAISRTRLLSEIIAHPSVLSREQFVRPYAPELEDAAHAQCDRRAAPAANHIDPAVVRVDLDALRKRTRDVERYGTKRAAHFGEHAPRNIPTFQDLDEAIEVIRFLWIKYSFLRRFRVWSG